MGSRKIGINFSGTVRILSIGLVAVWVLGQILRDRNFWTGLMFYFPTPVLVGGLLLLFTFFRTSRRLIFGLLIAPLGMLLGVENQWQRPSSPAGKAPISPLNQSGLTQASSDLYLAGEFVNSDPDVTTPSNKKLVPI